MSDNNDKKKSGFDRFRERHPILIHSTLIALALVALGYISLLTCNHDTIRPRYNLEPEELKLAYAFLFTMPGVPFLYYGDEIGIRIIYLKVNAMHPPILQLPKLVELPGRQGVAMLKAMGFKHVSMDSVPSPMGGMILEVSVDGHKVEAGKPVSVNSQIKLTVGDGSIVDLNPEQVLDPEMMDSIDEENYQEAQEDYEQALKAEQERKEKERKEQAEQQKKDQQKSDKDKKKDQDKKSDKKSDKDKKKDQDKKSSDKDKKKNN